MVNPYEPPASGLEAAPQEPEVFAELAERGTRFVAAMIDGFIGGIISFGIVFGFGIYDKIVAAELPASELALVTLGGFVIFLLVHGYTLAKSGQTLGKKVMNIQIVSAIDGKILPLIPVAALRYLPVTVASAIPIVGQLISLVNILFIFRSDRRCIHDHIAKTKVVRLST